MRAAGASGKGGMITMPAAGMIFREFPDEFRLAMPSFVWGPATAVLAAVGRLRRYPSVQRRASVAGGWEAKAQS
jgi:hypothetical protein